jgi:hypothetical protein
MTERVMVVPNTSSERKIPKLLCVIRSAASGNSELNPPPVPSKNSILVLRSAFLGYFEAQFFFDSPNFIVFSRNPAAWETLRTVDFTLPLSTLIGIILKASMAVEVRQLDYRDGASRRLVE